VSGWALVGLDAVLLLAFVLVAALIWRERDLRRMRVGVFVERERFDVDRDELERGFDEDEPTISRRYPAD
jgi:hypothetical protein